LTNECCKTGNLYGILLTGLGPDCIELFQNYIHRTSDVQTAAVAIIHAPLKNLSSKYVNANGWVESYRELLDSWMLWEQRYAWDECKRWVSPWLIDRFFFKGFVWHSFGKTSWTENLHTMLSLWWEHFVERRAQAKNENLLGEGSK